MGHQALVIGVGDYRSDSLASYPTITASARQYGEVFRQEDFMGPDGCRVLTEDEVRTTNGVMDALEEAAARTGPDDHLVVVYVGHGMRWRDLSAKETHFAVGTSEAEKPWKWLSSSYFYHVMRSARAGLKVLIADCCYSDLLLSLGGAEAAQGDLRGELPGGAAGLGVLGTPQRGTCVFTALKDGGRDHRASAAACRELGEGFRQCTPFSGHLLQLLQNGTSENVNHFTIGQLREKVGDSMRGCPTGHRLPRMLLNDATDDMPIFPNRMEEGRRAKERTPRAPDEWIAVLRFDRVSRLPELLRDEWMAGDVVARLLAQRDRDSRTLARYIQAKASEEYRDSDRFGCFLSRVMGQRARSA